EAMSVSDRIGVFQLGRLMQVGAPEAIYRDPSSLFVADFIGKINFYPATITGPDAVGIGLRLAGGDSATIAKRHDLTAAEKASYEVPGDAVVAIRPEHQSLRPADSDPEIPGVPGRVRRVLFLGNMTRYFVTCD